MRKKFKHEKKKTDKECGEWGKIEIKVISKYVRMKDTHE